MCGYLLFYRKLCLKPNPAENKQLWRTINRTAFHVNASVEVGVNSASKLNMLNGEHFAGSHVHGLTVNSEFINQLRVESPVSKVKKNELKRSHSWAASVTDRIRRRKNLLTKPAKGMLCIFIEWSLQLIDTRVIKRYIGLSHHPFSWNAFTGISGWNNTRWFIARYCIILWLQYIFNVSSKSKIFWLGVFRSSCSRSSCVFRLKCYVWSLLYFNQSVGRSIKLSINQSIDRSIDDRLRGAMAPLWWERSPPTNVSRVRLLLLLLFIIIIIIYYYYYYYYYLLLLLLLFIIIIIYIFLGIGVLVNRNLRSIKLFII